MHTRLTTFVGRASLLEHTAAVLGRARLVTLVGPGGVGKTRLASEVVRERPDVTVVHLADVTGSVDRAVVEALGIVDQSSNDPVDVLVEHLRGTRTLLVLDNCEHLLDPVGDLLATLLDEVPTLRVLATSRRHLELDGEHIVQVPPLAVPDDAMALLLDRASAAGRTITDHDAAVRLAEWSGGLPLVLELIAVRLGGGMSPQAILDRLAGGSLLTTRGTRRVQPHHRTLQQVLNWSYDLCSPGERLLWARISVFAGGFDLSAVEAVCSGDGITEREVVDLLEGLVHQSVVTAGPDGRYHQLQPLREFGQTKLDSACAIQDAHVAWFRKLAADAADGWFGPDEVGWMARAHLEMPNFRAALQHCVHTAPETGLEIATNLARLRMVFFYALLGEFCEWFERLLAAAPPDPTPERIGGAAMLGWIRFCQGSQQAGIAQLEHCRELTRGQEAPPVAFLEGAYHLDVLVDPQAIGFFLRAAELFGTAFAGDQQMAKLVGAIAACFTGPPETAAATSEDCFADASARGAEWAITWAVWAKGLATVRSGEPQLGVTLFQEALCRQTALGDKWGTAWCVEALPWAMADLGGAPTTAAELLGGASKLQETTGVAIAGLVPFVRERERATEIVVRQIGATAYREAYARGAAMSADEIHALALRPHGDVPLDGLSDRRRQVAVLIARGRQNKQIADELHLSLSTVENHVRDILRTLGMTNRAEVAAWVARHQSTSHA
ncbi:LuxR family transcriptional regulator [Lentzea sp. NBRC 105346]|uniref:ATP-binding protein n=1 Tax=Lentzea sp. NBRC 105346 TaxID=3032205 RepID=UPI0024A03F12|nr:LuxR C-terminal-related transcriptional regulator [Lentzea sp. NBRC 105346]GLZ33469.1 LuxR family transcriptional regulator [Lentzea sp. NBRC 105346]